MSAATLSAPPSTAQMLAVLSLHGELQMPSFTAVELAAVGAGSPLRGLVAGPNFLAMSDRELAAGMAAAIQRLTAEGMLESQKETGASTGAAPSLGGPLSTIVGLRRSPAVVVTVTLAARGALDAPTPVEPSTRLIAALHGMAVEGKGLVGLLEETIAGDDHHFVLCTPERAAERLWITAERLQQAEVDGAAGRRPPERVGLAVDIFHPDPAQPRHLKLVVAPANAEGPDTTQKVVHCSARPGDWESTRSLDLAGWQQNFADLTAVPGALR